MVSQGFEDFTNLNVSSSYTNGSFIGNDNITWTYVESRDGNGDANNSGINLPALMLRRASDDSKITSDLIPGGIGSFSIKLYKGFTGGGQRKVKVYINGTSYGESPGFDDYDEHIFEIHNIDVPGDFVLEIRNTTERQVIIDDITWTAFGSSNIPPVISQVALTPAEGMITPSDDVTVSASIYDADGIASASLFWGTSSGNLSNSISMTSIGGTEFTTVTAIPAQPEGTTIFYRITATDSNQDNPLTSSTPEFYYEVSTTNFLSLPYVNGFRTNQDYVNAGNDGFLLNNSTQETTAGGYLKMNANGSITTPEINFNNYNRIMAVFTIATHGGSNGQGIKVSVADDGVNFTNLGTFIAIGGGNDYIKYAQFIDVSAFNGSGRIKFEFEAGNGNGVIRFRDFELKSFEGYSYNNGWSPSSPEGISTANDDIFIYDGSASLTSAVTAKNLYVGSQGVLNVSSVLNLSGDFLIDGNVKFLSSETSNGELGPFSGMLRGNVEVQRYISENRAYRMVTSSVTTENSIHANWQEAAISNTDNPNPGYGTHITGTLVDQQNGFDATETGNPSMYTVNLAAQEFVAIDNTDVNNLLAGVPYLLFVRGDRSINLGSNTSFGATTLRAFGKLSSGNQNQNFAGMTTGQFAMFGNPYQSTVDVTALFAASDRVNTSHYYVFDPTLGDHGSYVTVDLTDGNGTNTSNSEANKYLQPGQAAQFAAVSNGTAVIKFRENQKHPGQHTATNAHRMAANMIRAQLYTEANFDNGRPLHDSFGILFAQHYNNGLTPADALKPINFNENFGISSDDVLLSLEKRQMPMAGEVFQIYSAGYQHTKYVINIEVNGLNDVLLFLHDTFEGSVTPLTDSTAYAFEVDPDNPASLAEDRFKIVVEQRLGVEQQTFSGIQLYPNPINGDTFAVHAPSLNGQLVDITVSDLTGRIIYSNKHAFDGNNTTVSVGQSMNAGIYLVNVDINGERHTFRVIKR